jgi:hypothetical protein
MAVPAAKKTHKAPEAEKGEEARAGGARDEGRKDEGKMRGIASSRRRTRRRTLAGDHVVQPQLCVLGPSSQFHLTHPIGWGREGVGGLDKAHRARDRASCVWPAGCSGHTEMQQWHRVHSQKGQSRAEEQPGTQGSTLSDPIRAWWCTDAGSVPSIPT